MAKAWARTVTGTRKAMRIHEPSRVRNPRAMLPPPARIIKPERMDHSLLCSMKSGIICWIFASRKRCSPPSRMKMMEKKMRKMRMDIWAASSLAVWPARSLFTDGRLRLVQVGFREAPAEDRGKVENGKTAAEE